jgi:predicted ATPase
LLQLEPWQESAHQQLMLALARRGDYTAALAQYETCRRLLAEELGVKPMPETTRLYERIRAARDLPYRHHLPSQPTPFIGRETALQELARLLSDPSRRLVTITGPGGAGKSRLALQAAAGLTEAFLHGVYLVPLAPLASSEHLPSAVGNALGFSFAGKDDPKLQLLRYLQDKELLLVLDNCEHLSAVADFVNEVLRAAFDHSWRLLPCEMQQALRQVAVFRGGFTPQAARQVAGAPAEILHALVDRSLLRWNAAAEESKRFDLHELLRQYAYEQLAEAGEEQATRTRHLDFFLDLAETARPGLDGTEAPAWMERLEAELDNFRAALDWSLLNEEGVLAGLRLASALAEFWGRKGYLSEGRTRLEALLARMDANPSAGDRTQSNFAFAQNCFEESLRLYRACGNTHGSAVALRRLGHALRIQGHYAQAVDCN